MTWTTKKYFLGSCSWVKTWKAVKQVLKIAHSNQKVRHKKMSLQSSETLANFQWGEENSDFDEINV